MDSVELMDVDEVWKTLGQFGRYQLLQLTVLVIAALPTAFHILSIVFIGKRLDHSCNSPPEAVVDHNATVTLESCKMVIATNTSNGTDVAEYACPNGYNYTGDRYSSFVSEWDIVCEKDYLVDMSQMIVMFGMLVGSIFLPPFADRFGRKILHVSSHCLLFATAVGIAFIPSFTGFVVLRFFIGVFQEGYLIPLCIMVLELFPAQQKEVMGFVCAVLWSISVCLITPFAYCLRNYSWRSLQLALALIPAFSIMQIFLTDESIRWLIANRKTKKVIRIIKKACKMNHKDFDDVWQKIHERSNAVTSNRTKRKERPALLDEPEVISSTNDIQTVFVNFKQDEVNGTKSSSVVMKYSMLDLLKSKTLRPITLITCYAWCINAMTYYGLTLLSSTLAGDPYVNYLIGALLEIPADVLVLILFRKIGRKKSCIFFHIGVGISFLITVFVAALADKSPTSRTVQTVFSLAGRFFIAGSFNGLWIYTPELFPTNIRNVGVGLASGTARIGAMASPFFSSLAEVAIWGPGVIFSAACFLVAFLVTFLPETAGRELPQTIAEIKEWRNQDTVDKKKEKPHNDINFEKV